jgi:protein CpxP
MKLSVAGSVVLAVAGIAMAGGQARAQGPGGPGMGPMAMHHQEPFGRAFRFEHMAGRWWNNPRVVEELKLTDEQRKAMDGILYDHREKLIDLQANLEKAELAMQPLMSADEPNEAAIDAAINKVVEARADLERADARFLLALRMKLTPEQWKQVQTFREDRRAGHEMWQRGPMPQRQWGQRPDGQYRQQAPPPPTAMPQGSPAAGSQAPATGQ